MTLAPIRGAPPGAPNPDFPIEEPKRLSIPSTTVSNLSNPADLAPRRQRGAPIEIGGDGVTLTFKVIPELPAISRATMTVRVLAVEPNSSHLAGSLQMSAANARVFLANLRNGGSSIVAVGDEDGTVQVTFQFTDAGTLVAIQKASEPGALRHCVIDRTFDIKSMAEELLADLGT